MIVAGCCWYVAARADNDGQITAITSETNAPRSGDLVEKLEIQPVSVKVSGDSVLWDFSAYKTGKEYRIRYREAYDGKIIESENNSVKYYDLRGDTLYLTRHGQPGMSVVYQVPEPVVTYPMSFGNHRGGYFYGEGNLGNINYIRNAGYSTTTVDSRGTLVTPDGDTIKNVLRSHYTRIGTTHIEDNFNHSFSVTRDSSLFRNDSICRWLVTDSVTHRIEKWRWYASGYRYPIAEAEKYKVYYYGAPVDSVSRYYYYRAANQEYDIEDDYVNEQIRYNNSSGQWYADNAAGNQFPGNGSSGISTKGNGGGNDSGRSRNTPYSSADYNIPGGTESRVYYPYCTVSPTIVTGSTTVSYGTNTPADLNISLHNTAGGVMWQYGDKSDAGDYSVTCPMDALPAGDYLMITRIGNEVFTAKLIKR